MVTTIGGEATGAKSGVYPTHGSTCRACCGHHETISYFTEFTEGEEPGHSK